MLLAMKHSSRFVLSLVSIGAMSASAMAQMSDREFNRIDQGKITKNEAQHLVLKKFPQATIGKCELRPGKQHSVWAVELVKQGEKTVTKLQIDGRTGKILP